MAISAEGCTIREQAVTEDGATMGKNRQTEDRQIDRGGLVLSREIEYLVVDTRVVVESLGIENGRVESTQVDPE